MRFLFEHRKIDRPEWLPAFGNESTVLAEFDAQCAERIVNNSRLVRAEENEIAVLRPCALHDAADDIVGQELENRRLQPVSAFCHIIDLDVRKAFGTVTTDVGCVIVYFLSAQLAACRQS